MLSCFRMFSIIRLSNSEIDYLRFKPCCFRILVRIGGNVNEYGSKYYWLIPVLGLQRCFGRECVGAARSAGGATAGYLSASSADSRGC